MIGVDHQRQSNQRSSCIYSPLEVTESSRRVDDERAIQSYNNGQLGKLAKEGSALGVLEGAPIDAFPCVVLINDDGTKFSEIPAIF